MGDQTVATTIRSPRDGGPGRYALVVNATIRGRGAVPRWFLATCLLPEGRTTEAEVTTLFAQLGTACRAHGVTLVGGHTEVTPGLDRSIVVGTMLGEVDKARLVTTGGARPGDALVLTKGVPVEGISIIARVRAAELHARGYADAWLARARGMVTQLSVVAEARLAADLVQVHAMHDPTEGAWRPRCGRWPMRRAGVGGGGRADSGAGRGGGALPGIRAGSLGHHRLGRPALGAGPPDAGVVLHALAREGIAAAFIGRVVPREAGVVLTRGGQPGPLPRFDQDEITRLFV
jgi:hydrogenase maturation factor